MIKFTLVADVYKATHFSNSKVLGIQIYQHNHFTNSSSLPKGVLYRISCFPNFKIWLYLNKYKLIIPFSLMAGLMATTWFLSMWISNTAATSMMIPIITAVIKTVKDIRTKTARKFTTIRIMLIIRIKFTAYSLRSLY